MSDFLNDRFPKDGFWNLLTSNMNPGSTSNAHFLGFSSQVPMSPEQQAFLEFQQNFQSQQQNAPNFSIPQQQSRLSNSLTQTEAQPKRTTFSRQTTSGEKNQIRYIGEHRKSSSSSQFGETMTNELRLKREAAEAAFEAAKQKDRTVMRLEEMKFLAISTKDLSEDDAFFIEEQKREVRAKYNLYRNPGSNPRGNR
nr:hypothetical protein [Tanacetum cinerariifolium]